jgi:2-dehydropantoate 2-reductase
MLREKRLVEDSSTSFLYLKYSSQDVKPLLTHKHSPEKGDDGVMKDNQRIAIVGAGAIGASIAAYLIRDGYDITVIDQWADHIETLKTEGMTLTDVKETFTVPVTALHLHEVCSITELFDVVFLAVKAYDTRWSTYLIEPLLKLRGFILPAQNSLTDDMVAQIVGYHRTVGCVPTISAGVYTPGHVVRTDPMTTHCFTVGELSGIITPRVQNVVNALQLIGPSNVTTNIWGARWSKMVTNCMGNALAGLIGPNPESLTHEQREIASLIRVNMGCEVVRVAQAMGVVVEPISGISPIVFAEATTQAEIKQIATDLEKAWSQRRLSQAQIAHLGVPGRASLLQDVIKGRRPEIEELNGLVVRQGKELNVSTPMNEAIVNLMCALQKGEVNPEPENIDRLKRYLPVSS